MQTDAFFRKPCLHLSTFAEEGEEIIVCRGKHPVARLVPAATATRNRPRVGEPTSEPFKISPDAFIPMSAEELKDWGIA